MNKELKKLLKQKITIYAWVSGDDHNDYTWAATGTDAAARIEGSDVTIRNNEGIEVLSTCQICVDGTVAIGLKDKITSTPEILKINAEPDENGVIDHKWIYTR